MLRTLGIVIGLLTLVLIPLALYVYNIDSAFLNRSDTQLFLFGLIMVPVAAAFFGTLIIGSHGGAYIHRPIPDAQIDDPLEHRIRGLFVQLTQDISECRITQFQRYDEPFRLALNAYNNERQVYVDQGYHYHYQFHHSEPHDIELMHESSENDITAEIRGLFDYYLSKDDMLYHPPTQGIEELPAHAQLVRVPGRARIRLVRDSAESDWVIAGFADTAFRFSLGLPVV